MFFTCNNYWLSNKKRNRQKIKENEENSQEEVIEAKMNHRLKQILNDINFDKIYDFFTFYVKIMYISDMNEFWGKI
jgi:hypothetical protein